MTSERAQTRLLTKTFFARLFETELMPAGAGHMHVVVSVSAFLAAPSFGLPLLLMKKRLAAAPDVLRTSLALELAS